MHCDGDVVMIIMGRGRSAFRLNLTGEMYLASININKRLLNLLSSLPISTYNYSYDKKSKPPTIIRSCLGRYSLSSQGSLGVHGLFQKVPVFDLFQAALSR